MQELQEKASDWSVLLNSRVWASLSVVWFWSGIYICESNQFRKNPEVAESFINTLKSVILHTENAQWTSIKSLMLFDSGKFKGYHCCAKQKTHVNNKDMLKYKSRKIIAPALPQLSATKLT